MYEVKNNIPPPKVSGRGRKNVYPFHTMQVGEYFEVPFEKGKQSSLMACAKNFCNRRQPTWMFTSSVVDGVVRVWRVA
jgi:hypothetical protein